MDDTMKRRLVGIGVLSLIILVVAWWLPDRDDGQTRLNPDRLPTETRVYDIHALDHPQQRGDDGVPLDEPADGEPALPPNIDPEFGQLGSVDDFAKGDDSESATDESNASSPAPPPSVKPAPVVTTAAEKPAAPPPRSEPKPAVQPAPEPAPKPAPVKSPEPVKPAPAKVEPAKPAPSQALPSGGWVVQVGSYGNQSNAESMRKKLEAKGYRVIVTSGQVNGKTFHRVRVGPYPQKTDASGAAQSLEKMLGQKVSVLPNS